VFTGLIESLGNIRAYTRTGGKLRLEIESDLPSEEVKLGDSIAIDGACLTVVGITGRVISFDAAEESLRRTTLAERRSGERVQLERAVKIGARLDGHIVQGHVDGIGRLRSRTADGDAIALTLDVPENLSRYMVEKGGIALDGTSLTITAVTATSVSVMLVPYSRQKTLIAEKAIGSGVNIEVDVLAKYVEKLMGRAPAGGIDMRKLQENGFV